MSLDADFLETISELEAQLALARYQLDKALSRVSELEAAADERFREHWKADVGNPFFEAARAAADERISALKHEARSNLMRAQAAERQLAEARALFKKGQG
jgi:hypothetical protein